MEHRQPTADSIVKSAHAGEFAVPEFQRGFVWSIAQVRELADSLAAELSRGQHFDVEIGHSHRTRRQQSATPKVMDH